MAIRTLNLTIKLSLMSTIIIGEIFFFTLMAFSQEPPIQWGEVSKAELEMTTFSADSNAKAVVLCDYGKVDFVNDFNLKLWRHLRIKIITRGGYEWGDVSIPYYAKGNMQEVSNLEACTIKLTPEGAIQRIKLDKKLIFDENVDREFRRIRFSFPALSPGCIIEYRYLLSSKNPDFLQDWLFQRSIPTDWSEFIVAIPKVLGYAIITHNISTFSIQEKSETTWPLALDYFDMAKQYGMKINILRWAMRDLPALTDEPYMTTLDDYYAKIEFQLAQIAWPGQETIEYLTTWEKLAEELMTSETFGKQLNTHGSLQKQAEMLTASLTDSLEKMDAVYDFVRTTMNWSGEYRVSTEMNLDKALQLRKASGAEIGLLLTSMLRSAGIDAYPVLISTRDNGLISKIYPLVTQFNHILTLVKIGRVEYLLDATDPLRHYDLLPMADLNQDGWLVDKKNPRWITINPPKNYSRYLNVLADLSADGSISAKLEVSDTGYFGLYDRNALRDKKEEEFIYEEWLKPLGSAKLDSFAISHQDSVAAPLLIKAFFTAAEYAPAVGDNIYLNPIIIDRTEQNPLKLLKRNYPVDYGCPVRSSYALTLNLPDGYAVQELPQNIKIILPNNGGEFRRLSHTEGKQLQYICQFTINKPSFLPAEYERLRGFYDQFVAAEAEQIVLKRDSGTSSVTGGIK